MIRSAAPERRYAILAEGRFADSSAKTAHGLIRYGKDEVACVMDSTLAGRRTHSPCQSPYIGSMIGLVMSNRTYKPFLAIERMPWREAPCGVEACVKLHRTDGVATGPSSLDA